MIQRISPLTAIALIAVVTALSNTITANAQPQEQLCACSPRSYSFQLLLDNDCSSSTLASDADNGMSNANCKITTVGLKKKRRLRRRWNSSTVALEYGSAIQQNDNDNDVIIATSRQSASSTPSYISSIHFVEFDTSGTLFLINEVDSYLSTNLTNGTVISYDSISQQLNASLKLEDQLQYVPGGAGLFLFGSNAEGEVVMRGRMVWEFNTGDCDVAPQLSGESLGLIGFDEITPASNEFCPASLTSAYNTASPTTIISPSLNRPSLGTKSSKSVKSSKHSKSSKSVKSSKSQAFSEESIR